MTRFSSNSNLWKQLLAFTLFSSCLLGQSFLGTIIGNVNDSTGAAIRQASVIIIDSNTGERRTSQTDSQGTYRFLNLKPGTYKIQIESKGFRRHSVDNVIVAVDATMRVDVSLQVGDVAQTLEVSSRAPLLQTETGSLSQVISARAVQELPLNGRNVMNLVALVPGVVPQGQSEGNMTGKNVFAGGNYQIGGGTANQSAAYLDGVPVNTAYGNIVALIPSQDNGRRIPGSHKLKQCRIRPLYRRRHQPRLQGWNQ